MAGRIVKDVNTGWRGVRRRVLLGRVLPALGLGAAVAGFAHLGLVAHERVVALWGADTFETFVTLALLVCTPLLGSSALMPALGRLAGFFAGMAETACGLAYAFIGLLVVEVVVHLGVDAGAEAMAEEAVRLSAASGFAAAFIGIGCYATERFAAAVRTLAERVEGYKWRDRAWLFAGSLALSAGLYVLLVVRA